MPNQLNLQVLRQLCAAFERCAPLLSGFERSSALKRVRSGFSATHPPMRKEIKKSDLVRSEIERRATLRSQEGSKC